MLRVHSKMWERGQEAVLTGKWGLSRKACTGKAAPEGGGREELGGILCGVEKSPVVCGFAMVTEACFHGTARQLDSAWGWPEGCWDARSSGRGIPGRTSPQPEGVVTRSPGDPARL